MNNKEKIESLMESNDRKIKRILFVLICTINIMFYIICHEISDLQRTQEIIMSKIEAKNDSL
jgi:hypothetical protein